jgi:hypothetical protein
MKIKDLVEAETGGKHVTFCFGRMNPPTIGHEQVFKTMADVGGDYKIFVSQTQDKKENPLDYATKTKFIKLIHPKYADHLVVDTRLNTIGKVCSYLYDLGYRDATFVAGSDRLSSFQTLISDYNGVEGKGHGYYKFEVLDFKSSGEREDGADGVKGISASKAREKAVAGDLQGFSEKTGAGQYAKELYHAVRKGMGVKDAVEEGWKSKVAGAALAGAAALGGSGAQAQSSGEDFLPDIVARVTFKVDGKEITKNINLGTQYKSPGQASEALEKFLKSKGIKFYDFSLERVKPKDDDYMDKTPYADKGNGAGYMDKTPAVGNKSQGDYMSKENYTQVKEAPIEMDPADPMDPMIHSHDKANPAKLKYRMLRAAGQLKDLAARAEKASPGEWELMARQFEELKMNMEQIRHALEELSKMRKKGGIRSRGITV